MSFNKIIMNSIKKPLRKVCDYICDYNRTMIMASVINKSLEKYKGINSGKNVYIIGGGPSVKKFSHKKTNIDVYMGINRAYKDNKFEFDYLFAQDQFPEGFDDFLKYRDEMCKKFLAIVPDKASRIKEYTLQGKYERYVLASRKLKEVPLDITLEPFADLRGTVFSVIQFALYTNPQNIFLVGIDNTYGNLYNDVANDYKHQDEGWKVIKNHLIDIGELDKITSINPVKLEGVFKDIFT